MVKINWSSYKLLFRLFYANPVLPPTSWGTLTKEGPIQGEVQWARGKLVLTEADPKEGTHTGQNHYQGWNFYMKTDLFYWRSREDPSYQGSHVNQSCSTQFAVTDIQFAVTDSCWQHRDSKIKVWEQVERDAFTLGATASTHLLHPLDGDCFFTTELL